MNGNAPKPINPTGVVRAVWFDGGTEEVGGLAEASSFRNPLVITRVRADTPAIGLPERSKSVIGAEDDLAGEYAASNGCRRRGTSSIGWSGLSARPCGDAFATVAGSAGR